MTSVDQTSLNSAASFAVGVYLLMFFSADPGKGLFRTSVALLVLFIFVMVVLAYITWPIRSCCSRRKRNWMKIVPITSRGSFGCYVRVISLIVTLVYLNSIHSSWKNSRMYFGGKIAKGRDCLPNSERLKREIRVGAWRHWCDFNHLAQNVKTATLKAQFFQNPSAVLFKAFSTAFKNVKNLCLTKISQWQQRTEDGTFFLVCVTDVTSASSTSLERFAFSGKVRQY